MAGHRAARMDCPRRRDKQRLRRASFSAWGFLEAYFDGRKQSLPLFLVELGPASSSGRSPCCCLTQFLPAVDRIEPQAAREREKILRRQPISCSSSPTRIGGLLTSIGAFCPLVSRLTVLTSNTRTAALSRVEALSLCRHSLLFSVVCDDSPKPKTCGLTRRRFQSELFCVPSSDLDLRRQLRHICIRARDVLGHRLAQSSVFPFSRTHGTARSQCSGVYCEIRVPDIPHRRRLRSAAIVLEAHPGCALR